MNEYCLRDTYIPPSLRFSKGSIYRLKHLSVKGEEFRYSDTGLVIDFPLKARDEDTPQREEDYGQGGYQSIHFTPTQYAVMKRLLVNLGEVVPFRELIAACRPLSSPDAEMRGLLARHICSAKKRLPPDIWIRCEYAIGYSLVFLAPLNGESKQSQT